MKNFKQVDPKQSFSKLEEEILKFWQENKIFEESIENRKNSEEFNFYDGPPFATGTPHYGHILAGTIKDVIPRYQTMKGFRVDRKFGWDCHGLPIENIVEKKLKISGKDDIEKKIGVYNFNEECRKNVFTYAHEWKKTVERMGRWVDMENDYKTMDTDFMESVWWVYKSIYDKGLIYEGHKVVPYCPRCTTPLSNFEVNQGYKDKQSKTVTLKFRESNSLNKYFLAWTTTPWTVPAVLALAIGKDIDYSEILDKKTKEIYVLATARISSYYKNEDEYTLIKEYKGESLIGTKIEPVFDDFKIQLQEMGKDLGTNIKLGENAFSIISGNHVTTDAGTGIVTTAPGYGEDDFLVAKENKVGFVTHIGDDGKTCNLLDEKNNGVPVFEFNEISLNYLKDSGKTIHIGTIDHSYPHCWRCDNPLIYRGISAWYVAVEKIRNKMVENNQGINWNPEIIKNGRFGKWVEGAIDWNISRNRYWGSAIPIWQNEDKTSEVCIGSIKEMYELNKEYGQITKIILVRHGQTDYNLENKLDSLGKANLTNLGIEQAKDIKEKFKNTKIDKIYSSPINRCIETIKYLSEDKKIEIIKDDRIKERSFGSYEGSNVDEDFLNLYNNKLEKTGKNGENINELEKRIEDFYGQIINENKGKTIIICSHGDIIGKIKFLIEKKEFNKENFINFYKSIDSKKRYIEKYIYVNKNQKVDFNNKENLKSENNLSINNKFINFNNNFYISRHGISENNDLGIESCNIETQKKYGLTKLGLENTKKESQNFKNIFDFIVCSPFRRTQETAKEYLKTNLNSKLIIDNRLVDINVGIYDEKPYSESEIFENENNILEIKYPEGENYKDVEERILDILNEYNNKYKGKNILFLSHGGVLQVLMDNLKYGKPRKHDLLIEKSKIIYLNDIQRKENIFKAKNVFGIHGFTGNVEKYNFWKSMKKNLKKEGIILNAPQFEEKENTRYFEWENKLNNSNISECDTVIAHSMGCRISMEYIIENKIKLKRLVLVSPAIRDETKEIINLYSELKHDYKNIINYVDEIIIVHSEDDDDVPVEQGEKLSKEINSTFIKLNGFGHFIGEEYKILEGIVEFGFLKEDTLENKNQEVDIHKHFVDEIYLKNENNFKAKNVLGIHGFIRDDKIIDFIEGAKINLEKQNINFDAPVFKKGEDISYIDWKEKLDSLNLNKYDTWLCHSLGCRVSMEYIIENKLKLKRLVLVAPGLKCKTDIVNNFYKELKNDFSQIKKFVKELIVIYDEDDKVHEQKGIKELIKLTGANYVKTSGNGHFNIKQLTLIEGIVKFGTPLKRVPEVLDCWFESGSMPYASKHYPFNSENKIKNLVFDFGKVLINSGSLKENIKLLDKNIDVDTFSKKYQTEIRKSHGENDDIMYDKIIEFSKLNITKKDILEKWTDTPNLELLKQIPDLAKKYKLYIFSNTTPDFIATFLKKYNIGSYFEKVIQSCDEKTRKPNKDFYEILFKKCNIIPQESLFFDDKKENIEMGENLGMNGFHFTDLNTNIENTIDKINNNFKFPADFIAEGLDQTRGWFYTLLVLGTALFDKAPMKNIIVNGIVLAEDGQKMSKSKQNYPDPKLIFDNYGADAMRFYLMNSPVVEAQDFRFVENGVEEVVKKVILPLWNTYYFFTTYANIDGFEPKGLSKNLKNNLDKWLISELNELTKEVSKGFDEYKLNIASKPIVKFMNNLTNWYIRRSRKRFWKSENDDDKIQAYETLYYTLIETCKIIAPFMPFVSEYIYKNLSKEKSVHLTNFPIYDENLINKSLNEDTDKVQKIITLGLAWRANNKIRVRQPLNSITITENLSSYYNEIIKEELNVKEVLIVDGSTLAKKICKPNGKIIGPKFGSDVKFIISEAKSGNFEELNNGNIKIGKFELESGDFELVFVSEDDKSLIESGFGMVISMDDNITEELKNEGIARDLVRQIQEARKQANYNVDDRIQVCITGVDNILNIFKEYIETETLSNIVKEINLADLEKEIELEELKVNLKLKK